MTRPLMAMGSPHAVLYGEFMTPKECQQLIDYAAPHITASMVVDNATGASVPHENRTSSSMFFQRGQNALVASIEERISRITGIPVENGEGIQVLRYEVGQEYRPHFDYFLPEAESTAHHTQRGGQRIATFLMYLNTPESGGETIFPDVKLAVCAQEGNALLFRYNTPTPETKTLHGGAPVLKGVKWVATKWLRQSEYA